MTSPLNRLLRRVGVIAAAIIALPAVRAQTYIFSDNFTDGERSTQSLPGSVAWYRNSTPDTLAVRNGALVFTPSGESPVIWAYFPKTSLGIGDTLVFSMEYSFSGTWAPIGTIRIGLLNSNGIAPVTSDLPAGPTGGYSGFMSLTQNYPTGPLLIYRRGGPAATDPTSPLITSLGTSPNNIWLRASSSGGVAPPDAPNTKYNALFYIRRTAADSVVVASAYLGGGLTSTNSLAISYTGPAAEVPYEFDTLAIGTNTGHFSGAITLTNASLFIDALPTITLQPVSQTIAAGSTVVFTTAATGGPALKYQWQRNGVDIPGETASTLVLSNTPVTYDGSTLTCNVKNVAAVSTTTAATLKVLNTAPADTGRLTNVSVRTNSGSGAQVLNVGLAVGGAGTTGNKPLLVRVTGPALAALGVPGTMADPMLSLQPLGSSTVVASNDNWAGNAQVMTMGAAVGAFGLVDSTSKDAAVVTSLSSGAYTVVAAGANGTTGTVLTEIYDGTSPASLTGTTPRLINVSARAQVNKDDDVLITGFAIGGSTGKTLLIRATGPALAGFGVPGTLADPKLELQTLAGVKLSENDNWGGSTVIAKAAQSVGAFAINDLTSKDAAILITLPPGVYTAKVTGSDGGTGVALVEVYEVP